MTMALSERDLPGKIRARICPWLMLERTSSPLKRKMLRPTHQGRNRSSIPSAPQPRSKSRHLFGDSSRSLRGRRLSAVFVSRFCFHAREHMNCRPKAHMERYVQFRWLWPIAPRRLQLLYRIAGVVFGDAGNLDGRAAAEAGDERQGAAHRLDCPLQGGKQEVATLLQP